MKKITVFITFILLLITSCGNSNIGKGDNSFIITPDHKYYIDYQNVYIELTPDTYITRDKQLKDYLTDSFLFIKNPFSNSNLINDLNKYFPYELKGVVKKEYNGESKEMPILMLNDRKLIDTVGLTKIIEDINNNLLIKVGNDSDIVGKKANYNVNLNGRSIHILNANGINGAAKKLGDKLSKELGITYNAENNSKRENYSYISTAELNNEEIKKIADVAGIDNIKISNKQLPNDYSATLIIGYNKSKYPVEIITPNSTSEIKVLLSNYNIKMKKANSYNNDKIDDHIVTIYYNPEDLLIAEKIASKIARTKLVEDNSIKNKIVITTNR